MTGPSCVDLEGTDGQGYENVWRNKGHIVYYRRSLGVMSVVCLILARVSEEGGTGDVFAHCVMHNRVLLRS